MILSTKVIGCLGVGLAGFVAGALSRQPEINELKKQVRSLQAEIERLHNLIEMQNEQVHELKIRYTVLKGWQFIQKNRQRAYIRGNIIFQYAFKEYLEILIDADKSGKVKMNKGETKFYNAFGKILNAGEITDKDRNVVIEYISDKYRVEIKSFREPDLSSVIEYLD